MDTTTEITTMLVNSYQQGLEDRADLIALMGRAVAERDFDALLRLDAGRTEDRRTLRSVADGLVTDDGNSLSVDLVSLREVARIAGRRRDIDPLVDLATRGFDQTYRLEQEHDVPSFETIDKLSRESANDPRTRTRDYNAFDLFETVTSADELAAVALRASEATAPVARPEGVVSVEETEARLREVDRAEKSVVRVETRAETQAGQIEQIRTTAAARDTQRPPGAEPVEPGTPSRQY